MVDFLSVYFRDLFAVFLSEQFQFAVRLLYNLFPFWGPPVLALLLFLIWVQYVRSDFLSRQKYVLLEIRLPREVFKSPLAMELALSGLFVTAGESTWYDIYILGKTRPWFSLELVSIDGNIHFYIWTREGYRNVVEAQLYGQYPNIEIFEVPDYTEAIPYFDPEKVRIWAHEYKLSKPDPYPIKTYVDFGLDKDPKEEFKIDPLTSVLEYMATLKKGEQLWIQILIQAHRKKRFVIRDKEGNVAQEAVGDVQREAKALIKQLLEDMREKDAEGKVLYPRIPTRGESEVIAAIERSVGKLNFDAGIRLIYAAKPENFTGARIPATVGIMRPFATLNMNSFAPSWSTSFDYPWQDYKQMRVNARRRHAIRSYRLRSWFHSPYKKQPFVLSSEELATIYHLPGGVLQAPTVERVMSKKAEAPVNLPQ